MEPENLRLGVLVGIRLGGNAGLIGKSPHGAGIDVNLRRAGVNWRGDDEINDRRNHANKCGQDDDPATAPQDLQDRNGPGL